MPTCPRHPLVITFLSALSLVAVLSIALSRAAAAEPKAASSERIDISPHLTADDLAQVTAEVTMGGTLRVPPKDGAASQPQEMPTSVNTTLHYDECRFTPTTGNRPTRSARYYDQAEVDIKVDNDGQQQKLADERR